jgi:hypothetical protein
MGNYKGSFLTIIYLFILPLFLPTVSLGQTLSDSLLAVLYNQTLTSYFPDTLPNKDGKKFGYIIIQTDFDVSKLIEKNGVNKFKFINSRTRKQAVLNKPLKTNRNRKIYWIKHNVYGRDTIDVNIGAWEIEDVNKKRISLSVGCGGDMGYIPDGRFIFNSNNNTWIFISGKVIITEKIREFMNQSRKK